jgi:hypothetical protein
MAKYRITGPDGGTYEVTAPDTASEAEVLAYAQQNYKPAAKPEPFKADPTGSTGDNILAGIGKAIKDTGRGISQRSAEMFANAPSTMPLMQGIGALASKVAGQTPKQAVADAVATERETRKLDTPLMNTGGGMTGNVIGNALMLAPTAANPAANTLAGAGMIGGVAGFVQPTVSGKETAVNTGLGAAGGVAGQYVANKLPPALRGRVDNAAKQQAADTQKFTAARNANAQGYVIPPADLQPGMLSEAVSGLSGKIKTAQVASQRNQQVTDKLARQSIGLQAGDELTADVLQAVRQKAAEQGYAPIRGAGVVQSDAAFFKTLDDIASTQQGAARSFPGLGENGVVDLVAKLKQPAFDAGDAISATQVLRETADKAYRQGDNALGKASKKAADAIEDMLDRHLTASGNGEAVKAFRDARTLIAKTYSVQKGLNSQTGNVSAQALAKQLEKGKPLSGELRTIAEVGQAFPKATQALKEAPKAVSPLDFAVAGTTGMATGNPLAAAMLAARPLARNALLSSPVQARALQQTNQVPLTQATQKLLENRLAQMLLAPVGTAGALQVGQ